MDPERFKRLLVDRTGTLRDAAQAIDAGAIEIALVVDDDRRLLGTVTDGDLRRALLGGASLEDGVAGVAHGDPVTAPVGTDPASLLATMTERGIEQIPLLEGGRVTDVAFIRDLVAATAADTPIVLMAGGEGQRLRPLTEEVPKPMLPVGDESRPLLETTLQQLADTGFSKVLLTVNYKASVIREHFGDGSELGLDISYVQEETPLGSAGALELARSELDRPFIVMNADLLTNVNLSALIRFHREEGNLVTVGVRQYRLQVPYGVVNLEGTKVTGLREKPTVSFFVNAGIYAVEPRAVELAPGDGEMFHMTDLIEAALAGDERVGSFPIREYWLDIGQLADYERAHSDHSTFFTAPR